MMRFVLPLMGTGSLLVVAAVLTAAMVGGVSKGADIGAQNRPQHDDAATAAPTPKAVPSIPARSGAYFAAITERPIFAPTRRPVEQDQDDPIIEPELIEEDVPDMKLELSEMRLHGISGQPDTYLALVSTEGSASEWLGAGTSYGGWTLSEIGSDWIIIKSGVAERRVELYK